MFSIEELWISFIIALGFIFLFKLQKELSPSSYFSMSDIFGEIEDSPSLKKFIIRIIMILSYGALLQFYFDNQNIIVLGMVIGSFLIVWPIFLSDSNIDYRVMDKKNLLRAFLVLFIITTYFTAKLSVVLFDLVSELLFMYYNGFNFEKLWNIIFDSLIWLTITTVTSWIYSRIKNVLNKKINL